VYYALSAWLDFQRYDDTFDPALNLVGPPPISPQIGALKVEIG
jgi:hypothetical protein